MLYPYILKGSDLFKWMPDAKHSSYIEFIDLKTDLGKFPFFFGL